MSFTFHDFLKFRSQESELERLTSAREAELKYVSEQNDLELNKSKELAAIESTKFRSMVEAIGASTLATMASAGTETQVCTVIRWCLIFYILSFTKHCSLGFSLKGLSCPRC